MILGIVCLVCGFLLAFLYNIIEDRRVSVINFSSTFNSTNLPIVRFKCGNNNINLLVDSGSDLSYISPSASELMRLNEISRKKIKLNVVGGTGSSTAEATEVVLPITHNNNTFQESFTIVNTLDEQFSQVRDIKGIEVHGIIGTSFLKKTKANIDFNKSNIKLNGKGNNTGRKRNKAQTGASGRK